MLAVLAAVLVVARSELCLQGGFESQLQQVLDAYMLRPQLEACIITTVADDVLRTLSPRWQGIEMTPFGSLVTGLGTHSSDLDFSVTMPNYNSSRDAEWDMLDEINELVMQQPDLYSEIHYFTRADFARYSFNHSTTHRKVDLVFRLGDNGVQNSKVIKYYFHLDDRFLPLGVLLKLAFEIHDLIGPGVLKNYAVYLLVIFSYNKEHGACRFRVTKRRGELLQLITVKDTERIKKFLKSAAAWFEDLPADRFLSAILSKQQDSDTQSSSEQNCIDIPYSGDTATLHLTCSK
ncbi:uncharacterized protein LOC135117963 [Helicoverpa armigera]|uniref:uncharacterized protein LOC135117963 n=1 Tax=Helicoverpa armigera TaxID=29058 RepID=UPI003082FAD4